jgi:Protein of unknown function (DUF2950)
MVASDDKTPIRFDRRDGGYGMSRGFWNDRTTGSRAGMLTIPLALVICLASCNKVEKVTVAERKTTTDQTAQKTFKSPEDAGGALFEAAKAGDRTALLALFGPESTQVLFMEDAAKDKDNLNDFVAAYTQMHRWGKIKAGGEVLHVGADNYTFPIPVGQNASGQWYFDTAAGKDEVLARRIGNGERTAIAASEAIADAEHQYFDRAHEAGEVKQYTQKFGSDPGHRNGLYWPVSEGQALSPLGQLGDFAKTLSAASAGDQPKQFNGYYYRILTKQGDRAKGGARDYIVNGKMTRGFAVLAFPADYRNSGIMSFLVGPDGVVYQKDLGQQTADVAAAITEYNPNDGWSPVTQPEPSPPVASHRNHIASTFRGQR